MTAIAIVGSRDFSNLELVRKFVANMDERDIVVTGGARGVDTAAQATALDYGLTVRVIKPDWKRYKRAAGMIRNEQIVEAADEVVAFWDGESRGTEDTINKARKAGKPVLIFGPNGESLKCPGAKQGEMFES
jgi:hypothetical protein